MSPIKIKALLICTLTISAHATLHAANKDVELHSDCQSLFTAKSFTEHELRLQSHEKKYTKRKIAISSITNGEFLGKDDYNWIYKGKYNGSSFKFTMKSGDFIITGNGYCTPLGAIGYKEYTQGNNQKEDYNFTFRDPVY